MITKSELELLSMKEARYDFLETDGEELSPINRPMARIAEQAQTFTALDLYKARADLELAIQKAEADLSPMVFKTKVNNLKSSLKKALAEQIKQKELLDDEIKILEDENGMNINVIEREWQEELQKKLQEEEANQNVGTEQSA